METLNKTEQFEEQFKNEMIRKIRLYGVCQQLREDSYELSPEQVIEKLKEYSNKDIEYNENRINEYIKKLKELSKELTEDKIQKDFENYFNKLKESIANFQNDIDDDIKQLSILDNYKKKLIELEFKHKETSQILGDILNKTQGDVQNDLNIASRILSQYQKDLDELNYKNFKENALKYQKEEIEYTKQRIEELKKSMNENQNNYANIYSECIEVIKEL